MIPSADPPVSVTYREIQEIVRTFHRSRWSSMQLDIGGIRVTIGKDGPPTPVDPGPQHATAPAAPAPAAPAAPAAASAPTASAGAAAPPAPAPAADAPAAPAPPSGDRQAPSGEPPVRDTAAAGENLIEVRSPAVGSFWVAPSPGAPPFVQIGDTVEADQQLAIVEVMKLMNPVVAPSAGVVVEVCAANADLVEFDQVLFRLRPIDE